MNDFNRLFFPRAIGIIGVNEKPHAGGYILSCLKAIKYDKPIYLFNPRMEGKEIRGLKVRSSILEIPKNQPIDYVIIAVPAKMCVPILKEVGNRKVPFVTIFTSGFSEVGRNDLENDLLDIARKYNMRIIGPNCLGVYNPSSRLAISRLNTPDPGHLGIISQSGGLSVYMSNMAVHTYRTPISKLISIGNQIDLNVVDFLNYFLTDYDTKVIGIYLENIKGKNTGQQFIEVVKKLSLKGKPVILWKVGIGESTKEAIFSHTGGMAGSTRIWKALTKQTGVILVNNSVELISLAMGLIHLDIEKIDRNLGIVAVGGGSSIELTDQMESYDLIVPKLHPSTLERFQEFLPNVNTILRNPLDLGGSGLSPDTFAKSLTTLDKDPNVSVVIFVKPNNFTEEFLNCIIQAKLEMSKPLICIAYKLIDDIEDYRKKLKFKREMFKIGVPVFESIELTAKALKRMCNYKEFLEKQKEFN